MRMFELLPRPLGTIFRKLTHLTCNSSWFYDLLTYQVHVPFDKLGRHVSTTTPAVVRGDRPCESAREMRFSATFGAPLSTFRRRVRRSSDAASAQSTTSSGH